jgi:hypothetical protein
MSPFSRQTMGAGPLSLVASVARHRSGRLLGGDGGVKRLGVGGLDSGVARCDTPRP